MYRQIDRLARAFAILGGSVLSVLIVMTCLSILGRSLNQMLHTAAIELARTHKQAICVALHPGTVATPFTAKYAARHKTASPEEAAANLVPRMLFEGAEAS